MKHIQLSSPPNSTDWAKQFMDDSHYDTLWNEDVFLRKPDGSPLMVLLKNVIPTELNQSAWAGLGSFRAMGGMRATAAGSKMLPKKRLDGTYGKQTEVPKGWWVDSGVAGFFERSARFPYAHECGWNKNHPEKFARVIPLIKKVNDLFKEHVPERWKVQKDYADRTNPAWMISDTVYTTLTINKNFRTACHKDAGDLEAGFSMLSVLRKGEYKGCHLVLPAWRVAADVQMGDLILFDAHEFHGNTQFIPISPGAVRCSIVYYYREMMYKCLSPADELRRAKNRKPGDPLYE